MNALIRNVLRAVPHGEAPERNPFKSSAPERYFFFSSRT
jgi:hypothetical protein